MNITKDASNILSEIKKEKPHIVGVDGVDGIGKSTFAKSLKSLGYEM